METPDIKHLVFSILEFFDSQLQSPNLSSDAKESLEVATQCLESAYGVSLRDADAAALYPLPDSLPVIFSAGLDQLKTPMASTADRDSAEKLKTQGNELLRQEKFQEAVDCYSNAIALDGRNAVYYCNRAAAYSKMGDHQKCLNDCLRALELDPNYSKAYGRKGLAHTAIGQHKEAKECFRKALELDPINDGYRENLRLSEQSLREQIPASAATGPGGLNLGGFNMSSLFNNPALMNMATTMLANPQMQSMMANLMSGSAGGGQSPTGPASMSHLLQAGQQLAQEMQASNPELVEQLRAQMRDPNSPANDDPSQSS